ncbi:MAG: cytochrome c [Campylobacteraceae bacterium]|nr:cytochrome c [Campylobacteraceae bacterium]
MKFIRYCQDRHIFNGKGDHSTSVYPVALANNIKLSPVSATLDIARNGLNEMPSFRKYLTDTEILEVVHYICIGFGNNFKDIA